jgi:hypothetical protein
MKQLKGSRGAAQPVGLQGRSQPWGSQTGISVITLVAGWGTNSRDDGKTLVIPNDGLDN